MTIFNACNTPKKPVEIDLLWTNPSPSSNYAAQTITLNNMSEYDKIGMICNYAATYPKRLVPMTIVPNTVGYQAAAITDLTLRTIEIKSSNTVSIGGAANGNQANLVPCQIYGIKNM